MTNQERLINTPEEAIECIKKNKPTSGYQMLNEALDMAIAALKKQISTGTRREYQHEYMLEWRYCPKCGNPVDSEGDDHYCSRCGQRLKFEEK